MIGRDLPEPDVVIDLMDEYGDIFGVVDPVEDSSDSSDPRDFQYPDSSIGEGESSESADSSLLSAFAPQKHY